MIALDDFTSTYNAMIDSIRIHYYSLNWNEKQLMAVDVEIISNHNGVISYMEKSIIGGSFSNGYLTFNSADYWKWWHGGTNNGGYCAGPNQGQMTESDAAEQIQRKVMMRKMVPVGYHYYFPTTTVDLWPEDYPNPNHSGLQQDYNYYKFFLFQNSSVYPNFHGCLEPDEMNFYLLGAENIVYTYDTQGGARPPSMDFIEIDLQGDAIFPPSISIYLHWGVATFGVLHISSTPPEEL